MVNVLNALVKARVMPNSFIFDDFAGLGAAVIVARCKRGVSCRGDKAVPF